MGWEVIEGGLHTTVQDLGRKGLRRYGVPRGGAADTLSFQRANFMVGNSPTDAALECTAWGPTLRALTAQLVAVDGASPSLYLDGQDMTGIKSFFVSRGQVLRIGAITGGFRSYLAVAGGFCVPPVLGSRSTYLGAGFGGYRGRRLRAGDCLKVGSARRRRPRPIPLAHPIEGDGLRVIRGPQCEGLTAAGLSSLFEQSFTVTNESDRMGCRLQGQPLEHTQGADIVSDGVPEGSLQVPGDGQPIIILADGQPTGGYTKPVVIITADLPRAAQLAPGAAVSFGEVSLAEAHQALGRLRHHLRCCQDQPEGSGRFYAVHCQHRTYQVYVEEVQVPPACGRHSPDYGE